MKTSKFQIADALSSKMVDVTAWNVKYLEHAKKAIFENDEKIMTIEEIKLKVENEIVGTTWKLTITTKKDNKTHVEFRENESAKLEILMFATSRGFFKNLEEL